MNLPRIKVTSIVGGLQELRPDTLYAVPEQPYSAIYIPEGCDILVKKADGTEIYGAAGDMVGLPKGCAHSVQLKDSSCCKKRILQPPFTEHEIKDSVSEDSGVVLALRSPTSTNPVPDIVPDIIFLSREELSSEGRLDLVFELVRSNLLRKSGGRETLMHRLAEVAIIILLDHVLASFKSVGINTAYGVGDPYLRKALFAIHETPENCWSLNKLADIAGLSRSVFAQRFKDTLGQTPMYYLSKIRMANASAMLRRKEESISQIAYRCGYESDAAFHKAFKRMFGVGPGQYRKTTVGFNSVQL